MTPLSQPDPATMARRIAQELPPLAAGAQRRLIAVAGPPASGKSTAAEALVDLLGPEAVLVPMDGFHLDNRLIEPRGLLPRKGAPETFDAEGFLHAMTRLSQAQSLILPRFDRALDLSIAGAVEVGPQHTTAVIEGNYLLFDEAPWNTLKSLWDLSIWIAPSEDILRARLVDRWTRHGLDPEAALARAEANDLPNTRRILARLMPADLSL